MRIIILGGGQVGYYAARYLAEDRFNITVIDESPEITRKISENLEVKGVTGHAALPSVLAEAGADQADMLIALTSSDDVNMLACKVAGALFQIPFKIARIREQEYFNPERRSLFNPEHLSIDVLITPEAQVANAIWRSIKINGAFDVVPFAGNLITVLGVRCIENTSLLNTSLAHFHSLFSELNLSILAIIRNNACIIPKLEDALLINDEVYFAVDTTKISFAMTAFGYQPTPLDHLCIIGGGKIGTRLAKIILDNNPQATVKIIEEQAEQAAKVSELLPKAIVFHGNALDYDLFLEANVADAQNIIAVTNDEQVNLLSAVLAKSLNHNKRSIAIINTKSYSALANAVKVDVAMYPHSITLSQILRYMRRGKIYEIYALRDRLGEIIEFQVTEASGLVGKKIRSIEISRQVLVSSLIRSDKIINIEDSTEFSLHDRVIVMTSLEQVEYVEQTFSARGYVI